MVLSSQSLAQSPASWACSHPNTLITTSPNVMHEKMATTDLILILSPHTKCAARSLSLEKLPGSNLRGQEPHQVLHYEYAISFLQGSKLFLLLVVDSD